MKTRIIAMSAHFEDAIQWLEELQKEIATQYVPMYEIHEREALGKSTDYCEGVNHGIAAAQTKVRALENRLRMYLDKQKPHILNPSPSATDADDT